MSRHRMSMAEVAADPNHPKNGLARLALRVTRALEADGIPPSRELVAALLLLAATFEIVLDTLDEKAP